MCVCVTESLCCTAEVNTLYIKYISIERKKFLVMRTFIIYSLNNYTIYHTAVLTIVIMLYITSLILVKLKTENLYLGSTFLQFTILLPSISGKYTYDLFFYEFGFFFFFQFVFLSICFIQHYARFIHIVTNCRISFFLWLSNIPVCVCV